MIGSAATGASPSRGGLGATLSDTWLLLTLRWRITFNGYRQRKLYQQILFGLLFLGIGGSILTTSVAVGFGTGALLNNFPNANLEPLLPGLLLTAGSLILLISSFGSALSSLFLSSDLELLMTAPVDRKAVFISKMLDSMGFNYAIIAVTALPALIAYGLGLGYGPLYYILAVLALIGMPLLPAGLGALLVLLVARFAPARRVREVLGFAAAVVGLGCSLLGQTSRVWTRSLGGGRGDFEEFLKSLEGLASLPIPSMIAGRGLAAAGAGDIVPALIGIAGFLLLTFGFFTGCVLVADNLYAAGWVRMQSSGTARRSVRQAERDAAQSGLLGRSPAYLAIALKDWRMIPRDLRNFAQLLWPIFFIPVVYFNTVSGLRGESLDLTDLGLPRIALTGVLIAGGVLVSLTMLFTQIANNAISMEGRSWWILKLAPISGAELLRGKFAEVALPFAVLSVVLMIITTIWQQLTIFGFIYGLIGILILGMGMLVVAISFSVPWAKLDWEDPRRMSSGWGSLASLAADLFIGLIGGGILIVPLFVEALSPAWTIPAFILAPLIAAALTAGLSYAALQIGLSRLSSVGDA